MANYHLIFERNGGVTLQTEQYCHHYGMEIEEAAKDAICLSCGMDTSTWAKNQPEHRLEAEDAIDEGFVWMDRNEVEAIAGTNPGEVTCSWKNIDDFFRLFRMNLFDKSTSNATPRTWC